MTDPAQTPESSGEAPSSGIEVEPGASNVPPVSPPPAWTPPDPAAWASEDADAPKGLAAKVQDRPEVAVGAAFAGGLVLALILKRLAR
ncbi:MAG: hypothetical protein M3022_15125 [Actinomycetota bacterium]|nr:hypothetical protein [Actinomycetota bacterium]